MCAAPKQGQKLPAGVDVEKETVLTGQVTDGSGEVVASPTGDFRFFAAPGTWTLRALSSQGNGDVTVSPEGPGVHDKDITVSK